MKIIFLVVLLIKLFALMIGLLSQLLFIEVKILLMNLLNKNLIMSGKDEHLFQQSNSYWICKKLIDNDEEKVRDHCRITGKFRGAAHEGCNINLQLTKNVSQFERLQQSFNF